MTGSTVLNNRLRNSQSEEYDSIMMTRTQSFRGSKSMDDHSTVCSTDEGKSTREETSDVVDELRPHDEVRALYETDSVEDIYQSEEYDPIMMTRAQSFRVSKSMDDNSIVYSTDEDTSVREETREIVDEVRPHDEVRAIYETDSVEDITQSGRYDPIVMTRTQSFRGSKSMDDNSIVCSNDEDTIAREETRDVVDEVRHSEEVRTIFETNSLKDLSSEGSFKHNVPPSNLIDETLLETGTDSDLSPTMGIKETKVLGEQSMESLVLDKEHSVHSSSALEVLFTYLAGSFALLPGRTEDSGLVVPRLDDSKRTKDEPLALKVFSRAVEAMLGDEPMPEIYASASDENDSCSESSSF